MDSLLFLTIFSALGIVSFIVGAFASRGIKTNVDYFLAGRNLSLVAVTFTLIAIQLGGNMLLGAAEWAYDYGIYGILYSLGMSVGFLLLASGFASRLRSCNVATTAQLFEVKYGSSTLRKFASFISIVSLLGILVSIVVSSRTLIAGLDINNEAIFIIFWLFIIGYTMLGGLHAVVLTDVFQVLFIIVCIGAVFFYSMFMLPDGLVPLGTLLHQQDRFSTTLLTPAKILATFLMPALFSLIEQDLAQPLFAARSQRIALLGAFCAGIFIITFGSIPVYFGMQAKITGLSMATHSNPLIAIMEHITNPLVFILVVCSVIAAITSTANSLLCAVSANIVEDFLPVFGSDITMLRISKLITLATGVTAVAASHFIDKTIIEIAIGSYEISVSCLLVPLVFALYTKRPNKYAAYLSALGGVIGLIIFRLYPVVWSKELVTLALSLGGYIIGLRLFRP